MGDNILKVVHLHLVLASKNEIIILLIWSVCS